MKYNPENHHRRSIRLKGYDYSSPSAYFITICTHQRECLLGKIVDGEMQLNPFGQMARSHWLNLPKHHPNLRLDAFVVMPNHVHGILVLPTHRVGAGFDANLTVPTVQSSAKPAPTDVAKQSGFHGIPDIIRGFKTFSSQRNYYEHIVCNEASLQYIRQYIQNNPLSWQEDQLHPPVPSK